MKKETIEKGIKEYKKYYPGNPNKFNIWWYGNEIWKYCLILYGLGWVSLMAYIIKQLILNL